jgi:ribonuclease G
VRKRDLETLIINYAAREKRFALFINNKVEKLFIDHPEDHSLVGNIFYGTVTRVLPGMNAAFVDIGEGKNAYIPRNLLASFVLAAEEKAIKEQKSITKFVHQGEKILVQIEKDATGTKGPKATGIIEIQGDNLIYMPYGRYVAVSKKIADESKKTVLRQLGKQMKDQDEGIIFRTSSMNCTEQELRAELDMLRISFERMLQKASVLNHPGILFEKDLFSEKLIESIAKMSSGEVIADDLRFKQKLEGTEPVKMGKVVLRYYQEKENIFSTYRVEHEIEKALKRVVWLENGAYLIFDETEALTIIDVNTGKFSGKSELEDTVVKTNRLAAIEIARQLRLRDVGGMILADFIDMKKDHHRQFISETMEQECKKDEKRTRVIGFTPLGILQLTRKKTRVSLSEALKVKCPVCEGTGRILSAETVAFQLERELFEHRHSEFEAVLVETTQEVKAAFEGPGKSFQSYFEEATHLKVFFEILPAVSPYYNLKQFADVEEFYDKKRNPIDH